VKEGKNREGWEKGGRRGEKEKKVTIIKKGLSTLYGL